MNTMVTDSGSRTRRGGRMTSSDLATQIDFTCPPEARPLPPDVKVVIAPYKLKEGKAMEQKLGAAGRKHMISTVETGDGGITMEMQAGMYELFRQVAFVYFYRFNTHGFDREIEVRRDQRGCNVDTLYRITYPSGHTNYTLTLHHTTTLARVNGRGAKIQFLERDLVQILDMIDHANQINRAESPEALNHALKQCLLQYKEIAAKPKDRKAIQQRTPQPSADNQSKSVRPKERQGKSQQGDSDRNGKPHNGNGEPHTGDTDVKASMNGNSRSVATSGGPVINPVSCVTTNTVNSVSTVANTVNSVSHTTPIPSPSISTANSSLLNTPILSHITNSPAFPQTYTPPFPQPYTISSQSYSTVTTSSLPRAHSQAALTPPTGTHLPHPAHQPHNRGADRSADGGSTIGAAMDTGSHEPSLDTSSQKSSTVTGVQKASDDSMRGAAKCDETAKERELKARERKIKASEKAAEQRHKDADYKIAQCEATKVYCSGMENKVKSQEEEIKILKQRINMLTEEKHNQSTPNPTTHHSSLQNGHPPYQSEIAQIKVQMECIQKEMTNNKIDQLTKDNLDSRARIQALEQQNLQHHQNFQLHLQQQQYQFLQYQQQQHQMQNLLSQQITQQHNVITQPIPAAQYTQFLTPNYYVRTPFDYRHMYSHLANQSNSQYLSTRHWAHANQRQHPGVRSYTLNQHHPCHPQPSVIPQSGHIPQPGVMPNQHVLPQTGVMPQPGNILPQTGIVPQAGNIPQSYVGPLPGTISQTSVITHRPQAGITTPQPEPEVIQMVTVPEQGSGLRPAQDNGADRLETRTVPDHSIGRAGTDASQDHKADRMMPRSANGHNSDHSESAPTQDHTVETDTRPAQDHIAGQVHDPTSGRLTPGPAQGHVADQNGSKPAQVPDRDQTGSGPNQDQNIVPGASGHVYDHSGEHNHTPQMADSGAHELTNPGSECDESENKNEAKGKLTPDQKQELLQDRKTRRDTLGVLNPTDMHLPPHPQDILEGPRDETTKSTEHSPARAGSSATTSDNDSTKLK